MSIEELDRRRIGRFVKDSRAKSRGRRPDRAPSDFFHRLLAVRPDLRRVLPLLGAPVHRQIQRSPPSRRKVLAHGPRVANHHPPAAPPWKEESDSIEARTSTSTVLVV